MLSRLRRTTRRPSALVPATDLRDVGLSNGKKNDHSSPVMVVIYDHSLSHLTSTPILFSYSFRRDSQVGYTKQSAWRASFRPLSIFRSSGHHGGHSTGNSLDSLPDASESAFGTSATDKQAQHMFINARGDEFDSDDERQKRASIWYLIQSDQWIWTSLTNFVNQC